MNTENNLNDQTYQIFLDKVNECKQEGKCTPILYRIINEVENNTNSVYKSNVKDSTYINLDTKTPLLGYYGANGEFFKY